MFTEEPGTAHREWAEKYGKGGVVRFRGFFGEDQIFFTDPAALTHILVANSYEYPKPQAMRGELGRILGKGILFAEGEDHRRQKKIMTPAFSPSALRDLTPIFFELSYKLRDAWMGLIETDTLDPRAFSNQAAIEAFKESRKEEGQVVLEVMKWMSRYTLDVIGRAGFSYNFDALNRKENLLGDAFSGVFTSSVSLPTASGLLAQRLLSTIVARFPNLLSYIPNDRIQAFNKAFATMDSESRKIIDIKRREFEESGEGGGKDLLSLMLKANASGDVKVKMSDVELQGQMTTFMLAGHETTSVALTWTLWKLAKYPVVQEKLRKEIRKARSNAKEEGREELESDELNSLDYLDAVCREILRTESPVSATIRSSTNDDMIPLSAPIIGRSGRTITVIPIKAGETVFMGINAPNFNKKVFGEDADDFRPERWIEGHVGEKQAGVGVYSHLLTFLAGPRHCIGYKFSLLEMKAALSVLVDTFEFDEREPNLPIGHRFAFVQSPVVVGEEDAMGFAMPLRVKLAQ
ncbi:hypothetical protein P7C70_g937, partial [Phenoliferia sp. Uapishka_3]